MFSKVSHMCNSIQHPTSTIQVQEVFMVHLSDMTEVWSTAIYESYWGANEKPRTQRPWQFLKLHNRAGSHYTPHV